MAVQRYALMACALLLAGCGVARPASQHAARPASAPTSVSRRPPHNAAAVARRPASHGNPGVPCPPSSHTSLCSHTGTYSPAVQKEKGQELALALDYARRHPRTGLEEAERLVKAAVREHGIIWVTETMRRAEDEEIAEAAARRGREEAEGER